ncbi:MAG: hypothetical protein IPN69_24905 [Acidobacteria bacterium]|nr:hypothetical protein [Acidobacteriota bacterium]
MNDEKEKEGHRNDPKEKQREFMRQYMRAWRRRRKNSANYDIEHERRKWREQHRKVREKAMERLGGTVCVNCGCDEFPILEINHINGGGRQALKTTQNRQLYRARMNDKIDLSEYNVLCRICNALHYVQDVLGIEGHQVTWRGRIMVVQRS